MIEPENNVAVVTVLVVKVGPCDWDRLVRVVPEDGERARGIEANSTYSLPVNVVLVYGSTDRGANAAPNVSRGLFLSDFSLQHWALLNSAKYIVACLWLPETNVLRSQSYDIALVVHDAGSRTTSTHINTNIVVDLRVELIAGVGRQLPRLLALRLSEWN